MDLTEEKNPAYKRQRISQPMRKVAPIFVFSSAAAKGAFSYKKY